MTLVVWWGSADGVEVADRDESQLGVQKAEELL